MYIYIYTSVDLCISMHRESRISSCSEPVVVLSAKLFVMCFVMCLVWVTCGMLLAAGAA